MTGPDNQSSVQPWIHSDKTRKKNPIVLITLFLKNNTMTHIERNQDVVYWIKLSRAQDQGLRFWQTKSFANITNTTVPGNCIDRVTSQNGDRVLFERLTTPRPALKVTLKSHWQTQQQQQQQPQQPNLEEDVQSIWKERATWESRARVREAETDIHLTVKEELTNTKEVERIKIGPNKICIWEDLAKEMMVFSKESSQAIFKMRNVELIELKKSTVQCPSCRHYVFGGTFLCNCGKLWKRDPDAIDRMKEACEILKAPFRASPISTRVAKCGPNLWQMHHLKDRDASRGATKGERGFTSIWNRWQNDAIYRKSQLAHDWSGAWVRCLDLIVHFSISQSAPHQQRERNMHKFYLRSVGENRQAPLLSQRPRYREVKEQSINLQKEEKRKIVPFIPDSDRKRLHKKWIFHCKGTSRTINGHSNGEWNNLELASLRSRKSNQATGAIRLKKRQAQSCHQQPESLTACLVFWVPEPCLAAIMGWRMIHAILREHQETFLNDYLPKKDYHSAIFNNSENLASSSQGLRPDTTETAGKRDGEMKRESLNTSVLSPHFQSRSGMLNHIGGIYSHHGMMDYPRIPVMEWNLGKFPDPVEFQSWKVIFQTEVCSKTADPQITVLWIKEVEITKSFEWHRCRLQGEETSPTTICLMRWSRLHWKSFSTRRPISEREQVSKSSVLKNTTDSYEEDKMRRWSTSICLQPELTKPYKDSQICSVHVCRMTTSKI